MNTTCLHEILILWIIFIVTALPPQIELDIQVIGQIREETALFLEPRRDNQLPKKPGAPKKYGKNLH